MPPGENNCQRKCGGVPLGGRAKWGQRSKVKGHGYIRGNKIRVCCTALGGWWGRVGVDTGFQKWGTGGGGGSNC